MADGRTPTKPDIRMFSEKPEYALSLEEFFDKEGGFTPEQKKTFLRNLSSDNEGKFDFIYFIPENPELNKESRRHTAHFPSVVYKKPDGIPETVALAVKGSKDRGRDAWKFQYTYEISRLCRRSYMPRVEEILTWGDFSMIGLYYAHPSLEKVLRRDFTDRVSALSELILPIVDKSLEKKIGVLSEGKTSNLEEISLTSEDFRKIRKAYSEMKSSKNLQRNPLERLVEELLPRAHELQYACIDRMNEFGTGLTLHQHGLGSNMQMNNYFEKGMRWWKEEKVLPYVVNFLKTNQEIEDKEIIKSKQYKEINHIFTKVIIPEMFNKLRPTEWERKEDQAKFYTAVHGDIKNMFVPGIMNPLSTWEQIAKRMVIYDCQARCWHPLGDYATLRSIPGLHDQGRSPVRDIFNMPRHDPDEFYVLNLDTWKINNALGNTPYPSSIDEKTYNWAVFVHTLREGGYTDPEFDQFERRHYTLVLEETVRKLIDIYSKEDDEMTKSLQAIYEPMTINRLEMIGYPFPVYAA